MAAAVYKLVERAPQLRLARLIRSESFTLPRIFLKEFDAMHVALDCLTGREGLIPKDTNWIEDVTLQHPVFSAEEMGSVKNEVIA
jgi:hypothetical protein